MGDILDIVVIHHHFQRNRQGRRVGVRFGTIIPVVHTNQPHPISGNMRSTKLLVITKWRPNLEISLTMMQLILPDFISSNILLKSGRSKFIPVQPWSEYVSTSTMSGLSARKRLPISFGCRLSFAPCHLHLLRKDDCKVRHSTSYFCVGYYQSVICPTFSCHFSPPPSAEEFPYNTPVHS